MVLGMTDHRDVVAKIQAGRTFDGVRWAYAAAAARTLLDYSEDAGYDAAWFGQTRHTLFRDRLDRVFSCGKYALGAGADDLAGQDLVTVQLSQSEIDSMPQIPAESVRRADLNGSPGWAFDDLRFLIASTTFGKIDCLPWPQKSQTKQTVASQPSPAPAPSLFDELPADEQAGLIAAVDGALDLDTFVIAHSLDAITGRRELVFGRPQLNSGGGDAWYWYENLLASPPPAATQTPELPPPPAHDHVPDAPVSLRRKTSRRPKASEQ